MSGDRTRLLAAAFFRSLGIGMSSILIGVYLAELDLDPGRIGFVVSAGLAGGGVATALAMFRADGIGRKRFLVSLTLVACLGGAVFAATSGFVLIAAFAFLGMLNGMGKDRGAVLAVEQAVLPSTTTDEQRTKLLAWYNVLQDVGLAVGALMAGLPSLIQSQTGLDSLASIRIGLGVYVALTALSLVAYSGLTGNVEVPVQLRSVKVSAESKRVIGKLSALFAVDGLGGGFLSAALVSFFFFERFGVAVASIGLLYFFARILNALSHFCAAWLAKRIGLINTMVFTHIPSSLLLVGVAFAPSFVMAAVLFLMRESLVQMDVPTRQSYVLAVVKPEERTFASGMTGLVRLGSWAAAPVVAGFLMAGASLAAPLFVGAGLKISYDLALYSAFRHIRPPEEQPS